MMFVNRNCSLTAGVHVPGVVVGYSFLAGDFPENVGKQTPLPDCFLHPSTPKEASKPHWFPTLSRRVFLLLRHRHRGHPSLVLVAKV